MKLVGPWRKSKPGAQNRPHAVQCAHSVKLPSATKKFLDSGDLDTHVYRSFLDPPLRLRHYCRASALLSAALILFKGLPMLGRNFVLALSTAVALAACSADSTAPIAAPSSLNFARSVGGSARHIVLVNGNTTAAAFTARVAALGGSVTSFHQRSGFAVVSGLTSAAATKLAASGVAEVAPDFE